MDFKDFGRVLGTTELTYSFEWDTVIYAPGQNLTRVPLFSAARSLPRQYQSTVFPLPGGRIAGYKYVSAVGLLPVIPENVDSTDPIVINLAIMSARDYFLSNSYLEVSIEDKLYSEIPLSDLVRFAHSDLSNVSGNDSVPKYSKHGYFELLDIIRIPEQGKVEIVFVPAQGLKTASVIGGNFDGAYLPGVGLEADKGWFLKFFLYGLVQRSVK